jgi:nicotinate-nucleotide adenylyltransferase
LICLFGGTFDPVHVGHLHAAARVCEALGLGEIRFLLAARPGHRRMPVASVEHRWEMLRLACASDSRFVPDDREIRRAAREERPSYTVDTLEDIRREAPRAIVLWVIGRDQFEEFLSWHRPERVLELAHLVVLERPGPERPLAPELARLAAARRSEGVPAVPAGRILFLALRMLDVSATEIRAALAGGGPVAHLLPPAVYTYITAHGLYGVRSDPGNVA